MKNKWIKSDSKLMGHTSIEHTTSRELALVGFYGEIWQYSDTEFRAIIYSHRVAKRYLPKNKHPMHRHDEILIKFERMDLALWIQRLRIPAKSSSQADLANRPSLKRSAISNIEQPSGDFLSSKAYNQKADRNQTVPIRTEHEGDTASGTENYAQAVASGRKGR